MQIPLNELLYSLSRALDFVEQELLGVTTNHGKRTAYVTAHICKTMGLSDAEIFDMACCAILHDNALTAYLLEAGLSGIPQLEHMKKHCSKGEENASAFPFLGNVDGIILHHHENWDGSGFHKLAGDDIPLRAIILRLADVMDLKLKMGDGRNSLEREIRELAKKQSGKFFAPRTVEALNDTINDDFINGLADCCIDEALRTVVPPMQSNLTTKQMLQVCNIFALIIDAKSPFTRNHSTGIVQKAARLADIYGFDERRKDKLMIAGYLHDLGKLSTPLSILEKPGPLDKAEFEIMKDHVAKTEEILISVKGLEDITRWAAGHHETLDGGGYHRGYPGSELPLEGRMLACCDIFQALTEDRPYRKGMEFGRALKIMEDMAGRGKIDAQVVKTIKEEFAPREEGVSEQFAFAMQSPSANVSGQVFEDTSLRNQHSFSK